MMFTAKPQRRPVPSMFLLMVQGGVAAIAMVLLFLRWEDAALSQEGIWGLELLFTAQVAWAGWSWWLATGRLLDGYLLFFAMLTFFNGGQMVLDAVGLLPEGLLDNMLRDAALSRAVLLVNATVSGFHFGALLRTTRSERRSEFVASVDHVVLRRIGLVFILLSSFPTLKRTIESIQVVVSSGYFALFQQTVKVGIANWDGLLAAFLVPGTLITFATASKSRWNVRICWALALVNFAVNLFLGSRAAAGTAMLPMILLHHWLVRRLRTSVILAGVISGLLVIPWIAGTRNLTLEERLATSALSGQPAEIAAVDGLKEMGGSMGTVVMAIALIPERRPFDYGAGYLRAVLTVVPNLFWDIHPTVKAGLYGDWLIREVDPDTAARGGGLGFSVVGEAYANFSWLGTPLVMFAMGWLLAGLVLWARSGSDPTRLAFEAVVLSAILLLPRGETASFVRSLVWTGAIPYLIASLSRRNIPASRQGDVIVGTIGGAPR